MLAHAYIDGFNLYYGIKKWPAYKWLDVQAMLDGLFPNDQILLVRYFTANVSGKIDRNSPLRQDAYLRALDSLPRVEIKRGRFLANQVWMPLDYKSLCLVPVIKTEEKGSDVNLATYLLLDAFEKRCEKAIVVSNDSDLKEPIRVVQNPPLGIPVTVLNPFRKYRAAMAAGTHLDMQVADVRDNQLPGTVTLADGTSVTRPTKWR